MAMLKPFGQIRLSTTPVADVWHAPIPASLHAVAPRSTVTVHLDGADLRAGDQAGLVLLHRPYAWIGIEYAGDGLALVCFDERAGASSRLPAKRPRVWLRVECDFTRQQATFGYSLDGEDFLGIGAPYAAGADCAAGGLACGLFARAAHGPAGGGVARFDSFVMTTEIDRGR